MRFLLKTDYGQDVSLHRHGGDLFWYGLLLAALALGPFGLDDFHLGELALVLIYAIAGVGLMLLVGFTGQVSLGHAAFLAIGAYAHAILVSKGVPFLLSLPAAGLLTAAVGAALGAIALRMVGIYLAIATLAFAMIVEKAISHWEGVTGGFRGFAVDPPVILGQELWAAGDLYVICLVTAVLVTVAAMNLLRSPTGRAMVAVRDSEISAQSLGVHLARTKTTAFALSAGITGIAGGLLAHKLAFLAPDAFGFLLSVQLLLMVVVGGLGSLKGAFCGAVFLGLVPQGISMGRDLLPAAIAQAPGLEPGIFGLILVLVIVFEPHGIVGRWEKVKLWFQLFPMYRKATFQRQKVYARTERLR